jgi:hypothetical protein
MKTYTINQVGLETIKKVLQDCHKMGFWSLSQLFAYAQDAEQSANTGDSVAVFEIVARHAINGFTQAYYLDLNLHFDMKKMEE